MNGQRLTFISGPNSGGKTTICKSIVQNQLLAQIGSYVLADAAAINIADVIRYQAPKFDGLQDDEGRVRYRTRPNPGYLLFDYSQKPGDPRRTRGGDDYEERQNESFAILSDFHTIGNNTVLVTHNHSLVDSFVEDG